MMMRNSNTFKGFIKKNFRLLAGLAVTPFWPLLKQIRGDASILCYHRIAPLENHYLPSNLIVPPDVFEKHLAFLSKTFRVVSMDQLLEDIKTKRIAEHTLAVTFDDGYFDFKTFALPLLHQFKIPATVYLSSDFLDGKGLQWWHLIDEVLLPGSDLVFAWQGEKLAICPENDYKSAYNQIRSLFINSGNADHGKLADILIKASGNQALSRRKYQMITWEDLATIKNDPLISIGAHTLSHCVLSQQTKAGALKEMSVNKADLENALNSPIRHFAYPFGTSKEAGEREYRLAEKAGFSTGVTLIKGHLHYKHTNLFSIPRFHVPGGNFGVLQLKAMISGLEAAVGSLKRSGLKSANSRD